MNLILTVVILTQFESKPDVYPTLSQQYHRSKMYEPYLDVKYLLQYKDFKVYAVVCAILLASINVSQAVPYLFLFDTAQSSLTVFNILYIFSPLIFLAGLIVAAMVLSTFNQTNQAYKMFILLLIALYAGSIFLVLLAFAFKGAGFYAFATILCSASAGALKLCLYEFMTEMIFPVSPVFALAILNSLSGLLTAMVILISNDVELASPLDTHFVFFVLLLCLGVCGFAGYVFFRIPYKLNRTDYDTCRRMTMISSYGGSSDKPGSDEKKVKYRGTVAVTINDPDEEQAHSINSMLSQNHEE